MSSTGINVVEEGMPRPISTDKPTPEEIKRSEGLVEFLKSKELYETPKELAHREEVIGNLTRLLNIFVKKVAEALKRPNYILENARGKIFTFGSYRLSVQSPGANIDVLCVTPNYVTREHFFNIFTYILKEDKDIEEMNSVEAAYVPLIKIKYEGVDCDLLFASLPFEVIKEDLNIVDDNNLEGGDESIIRSFSGCRTDEMILRLVNNKEDFRFALKLIKEWANERGIYSNKMGYLGGGSLSILMCFICELYPNACSFVLLKKFFNILQQFKWENPLKLKDHKKYNTDMDKFRWDPEINRRDQGHKMVLLTPAYPGQNSTPSVNSYSLKVIVDEFKRGNEIIKEIEKGESWDKLIEPIDFFYKYCDYLAITITADTEENIIKWKGFCESKLRKFVEFLGDTGLYEIIHLYPKEFIEKKENIKEDKYNKNSVYFIGLELKSGEENIDISIAIEKFYKTIYNSFMNYTDDMIIDIKYYEARNLPTYLGLDYSKIILRKITSKNTFSQNNNSHPIRFKTRDEIFNQRNDNSQPKTEGKGLTSSAVKRKPVNQLKNKKKKSLWDSINKTE